MLFLLSTPDYTTIQSNTTKIRVHLRTGVAEIFDQHQDLMGKVENDIVEIETNNENRIEKSVFVVQDAVFIVSNQGLDVNVGNKGTGVYLYAKRVKEINSALSLDDLTKEYEQMLNLLENENQRLIEAGTNKALINSIQAKILLSTEKTEFLKKTLGIMKKLKG